VTLADLLFAPTGTARPDDALVHAGEQRVTRTELTGTADRLAGGLRDAGVAPGAAVAVMLGNTPAAVAALFGVWRAGAVHVPLNPRLTGPEVRRILDAVPVAAAVTEPEHAERFTDLPLLVESVARQSDGSGSPPAIKVPTYDPDVALVQLTSGTTGPPTPVPLRHSTVLDLMDRVLARLRGATERPTGPPMPNLVPVSLSLWAGIYNVCFAFRVGAPVVLMERFETDEFASLVARHRIRSVVLPPAAMTMLLDDDQVTSLEPLRFVRSITAPLPPAMARRFRDRFGVTVLNSYGQTELGGEVIGWDAADARAFGDAKLGAVGRPHQGVEVRVIADAGAVLGTGEVGELLVRTPARSPDASLAGRVDRDGWLRTGDLARLDADGFVWIEGRVSDVINRGGLKVFPAEVEHVLQGAPGVREVAVVGAPDERLGQVPVAFVVGNVQPRALEEHCRAHLAPYKVPARFVAVDALPRTEIGKVRTGELLRAAAEP
jgi:long-chain acyl-CoA synthetase